MFQPMLYADSVQSVMPMSLSVLLLEYMHFSLAHSSRGVGALPETPIS